MISQCAPTLAGIKTGSLYGCYYASEDELKEDVRRFNKSYGACGLRLIPMRYAGQRALLYLYRPGSLKKDLENETAQRILSECGYRCCGSCDQCIARLRCRICEGGEFPHEVGLFLSYPPEDVNGDVIAACDGIALGCPAMGAEELEDSEFAPMFDSIKAGLAGKKVALFGSYGWGCGDWMNAWEQDCAAAGITLAADSVICNEAPDGDALDQCKALGAALC